MLREMAAESEIKTDFQRFDVKERQQISDTNSGPIPFLGVKCLFICQLVLLVIGIVTIVISIIAVSRAGGYKPIIYLKDNRKLSESKRQGASGILANIPGGRAGVDRIYTLAIGHDFGAHEYLDKDGRITGFHVDLIKEVCKAAGINCVTLWDTYVNCWKSVKGQHGVIGPGLVERWYDACTGWSRTITRDQSLAFSEPWLVQRKTVVWIKKGSNFVISRALQSNGPKVGFLDGWASDEKCFARYLNDNKQKFRITTDVTVPESEQEAAKLIEHYVLTKDLRAALINGSIAAAFAQEGDLDETGENQMIIVANESDFPKYDKCKIWGGSMMARKDNQNDFVAKFNKGLAVVKSNGKLRELCKKAEDDHAHKGQINCIKS